MATTAEDIDTLEALVAYWAGTPELYDVTGAIQSGDIKSPQPMNYAHVASMPGPSGSIVFAPVQAGAGFVDHRQVTITCRGTKSDMTSVFEGLREHVSWLPRDGKTLAYPSGAILVSVRPLNAGPKIEAEKEHKDGKEVWKVTADYEIASSRTVA